ncbi:MAG TPA: hypothetical protein VJB87_05050 [Candidatus Nanoarchaeia archaeon]|nr:hypothetical protein [Candidatus Nanoarchaeia archaeon]
MTKDMYLDVVLAEMPRLLGLIDRNPLSKTFGCADRQFWLYRTVDFAGARYQEACLTLALLYQLKEVRNPYYHNPQVLSWIKAMLDFWSSLVRSDGSVDEWYPFEHSFVATAFSLAAVTEVVLLLPELQSSQLLKKVKLVGSFLLGRTELRVQNQLTGALLALYNVFLLTNDSKFESAVFRKVARLEKLQSVEGWFSEYGGADVGYLSLAVDYLAKLYWKSRDMNVLVMAQKACQFLWRVMPPVAVQGGDVGSRNTEYLIPSGFELLPGREADALSGFVREQLSGLVNPSSLDDRYLAYNLYTYVQAFVHAKKKLSVMKHSLEPVVLPDAGWLVMRDPFVVVNGKKGGAFRAVLGETIIADGGVQVLTKHHAYFSGVMHASSCQLLPHRVIAEGRLCKITNQRLSPLKMVGSRLFQLTLGCYSLLSRVVKNVLRDVVIKSDKKSAIRFVRDVVINNGLTVTDVIVNVPPSKILLGMKASYNMVPSSKYFHPLELASQPFELLVRERSTVKIIRRFDNVGKSLPVEVQVTRK